VDDLETLIRNALNEVGEKPSDSARAHEKKGYSERVSHRLAEALAAGLRDRGMDGARPHPEAAEGSGAERRMSGGIGAKKVDVTWATEESGLLLGLSIKSINFVDRKTGNYQKNLTNRRGDMLFEAVTLHRRFPYAVLGGFFLFDEGAADDGTRSRQSTFLNAHHRLRLFTGRDDPAGRDEQYERLFVGLIRGGGEARGLALYLAGEPDTPVPVDRAIRQLIELVAERDPDFYRFEEGRLKKA
jgi:hypothetical protein